MQIITTKKGIEHRSRTHPQIKALQKEYERIGKKTHLIYDDYITKMWLLKVETNPYNLESFNP